MSESKDLTVRTIRTVDPRNGGATEHEQTRAIWAGAGTNALSPDVARALAIIGERYSLDPALGEVMILGNRVYITAEGYERVADQHPQYDGLELWPLNADERKAMKVGDDEHAFGCRVWRKDRRFPAVGYGVASDRSIAAGPIKVFAREVAEKRAIHRALRLAFRVGIPDADDATQEYQRTGSVALPIIEQGTYREKAPAELPQPDWARFWSHVKGLGVEHEEAHRVLGVGSLTEWPGSLEDAVRQIERYVLARDQEQVNPAPAPQAIAVAPARGKPPSRAELERLYRDRLDKADALGVPGHMFDPKWTDAEILQEGRDLKAKILLAEAELSDAADEVGAK